MNRVSIIAPIVLLLVGCTVGRGTGTFPAIADMSATPALSATDDGGDHRILVANGLGETLTLVTRIGGTWNVTPDFMPTGQGANQAVVRNGKCYIVNSLSNAIQVIDVKTLAVLGEVSTGPGTNPVEMDFIDDKTAMVSCYLTNEVVMLSLDLDVPQSERVLARIAMPSGGQLPHDAGKTTNARPGGIVVVADKCWVVCANLSMVHVAGGPGVLAEIDIPSRKVVLTKALSGRDTTGLLHSERFPERLIVISAGDYSVTEGFEGNGMVESIDMDSDVVFQEVRVDGAPFEGAVGPDDVLVLENAKVGALLRVDLHAGKALSDYPLPTHGETLSYASAVLALPGLLCVTDFNADRMYLLEPSSGEVLAQLFVGDGPDAMVELE